MAKADATVAPLPGPAEQVEAWEELLRCYPAPTTATLRQGLQAAAWRALGAALTADPAKAPAAAQAAAEALQAAATLDAPEASADPVGEAEVVAAVRRSVRRGLAAADPKQVAAAVDLWRAQRAWCDPEGVAGAAGAEGEALAGELLRDAETAEAAALAMDRAGEAV